MSRASGLLPHLILCQESWASQPSGVVSSSVRLDSHCCLHCMQGAWTQMMTAYIISTMGPTASVICGCPWARIKCYRCQRWKQESGEHCVYLHVQISAYTYMYTHMHSHVLTSQEPSSSLAVPTPSGQWVFSAEVGWGWRFWRSRVFPIKGTGWVGEERLSIKWQAAAHVTRDILGLLKTLLPFPGTK